MAGRERPTRRFTVEVVLESGPESIALAVRTLSAHEQEQAHAEAIKWLVGTGGWMREDLIGDAGDAVLNLEVMVQILARALVDPDRTDAPFAADAAELRRCFDVDEVRACFDETLSLGCTTRSVILQAVPFMSGLARSSLSPEDQSSLASTAS